MLLQSQKHGTQAKACHPVIHDQRCELQITFTVTIMLGVASHYVTGFNWRLMSNEMSDDEQFSWLKGKPDTLKFHFENGSTTHFEYTRGLRLTLGKALLGQKRIYLDTKYWLFIRDVFMQRSKNSTHIEITSELRRLRKSGSTIFPVSYAVYVELMHQKDIETRTATALMVDELSGNCAIVDQFTLFKTELAHFWASLFEPAESLHERKLMVWRKATSIMGDFTPEPEVQIFTEHQWEAMKKAMVDLFWNISFSELVMRIGTADVSEQHDRTQLADTLNAQKQTEKNKQHTYQSLLLDEIAGGLEANVDDIIDYMGYFALKKGFNLSDNDKSKSGLVLQNVIFAAFRCKKIGTSFPSLHIPSALHAMIRLQKERKYKKNDFHDIQHATNAVGYCDAFFTETSLRHLLTSKYLMAETEYGCKVLSDDTEILTYLKSF
ncbi:hypothetical protein [Lacunimicrobium album]